MAKHTYKLIQLALGLCSIAAISGCGFMSVMFSNDVSEQASEAPLRVVLRTSRLVTNASPIQIQVAFSENVTGFANSDIVVTGGTKSGFSKTTSAKYKFQLTPSLAETTLTIKVPAAAAKTSDGSKTPASAKLTVVYDSVAPNVATIPAWGAAGTTSNPMLVAGWTLSPSVDLYDQEVIVYSDAVCGTAVHTEPVTVIANSYIYLGSNGSTYSFRVKSLDEAGNESLSACSAGLAIDTAPPTVPVFVSASPASPSTDLSPAIIGTSSADTVTLNFYSNSTCTTAIGTGTKAAFEGVGIDATVAADATTSIYARALDALGNASACTLMTSYVHDSTPSGSAFAAGDGFSFGISYAGSLGVGAFMSPYNPGDLGALVVGGYSWAPALTSDWADSNHGCRVTTTGEAYCWGYNVSGQLGTGNNVATLVPTAVTGGLLFDDVGTSEGGTCGIQKTTGSPYCWGNILGDGTGGTSSTPVKVSTTDVYTSVSGGADYMCGLRADGKAYCWGSNSNGQLGIGTLATTSSNVPVAVAGGLTFATLTTGYRHACGVTALGAAYCWGLDTWAQLGSGAGADDTAPALVQGGYTWAKVSAGQYHTCGVTTSNVAYCWGSATYGQLGNGDIVTPQPAPSLVSGGYAFKDIATGINNSCAITTTDTAYCWGSNSQGQLGNDSLVDVSTPVAVLGGKTFKNLSMSYSSTCGMTLTNEVRCWGAGTFGRLGNALASKATALDTAHLWTAVEAGDEFACGIAVGGALYCWGSNTNGKLGDGGTERKSSPTAVSGGLSWKKIAVGKVSACGVTSTDAAYCWGGNANGQIGNSSATASFDTPQLVSGGLTWTHISVGSTHACGIATGGAAYCWGNNTASGYLGNGSAVASTSPVLVSGGLTWISISAGHAFSCGVATGGTGYCWGSNTNYEHGRGVTTLSNVPAPISGGLTLASIFAGSYGACAVTTAGAGYCWGYNGYGAVGDGTAVNKTVPTLVLGGHVWREISVGTYHSCGITTAGAGYCWGKGADGAVGSGAYVDLLSPAAIADVTDVKALAPSVSLTIGVAGP